MDKNTRTILTTKRAVVNNEGEGEKVTTQNSIDGGRGERSKEKSQMGWSKTPSSACLHELELKTVIFKLISIIYLSSLVQHFR